MGKRVVADAGGIGEGDDAAGIGGFDCVFEVGFVSPITHLLMGWTVANAVPSLTKRERAFVTWASVVPDVDGFGIIADLATKNSATPTNWWGEYHHVLAHNIGFALLVTALAAIFARDRLLAAALVFVSFHLHLLGDLVGAKGPDGDQWPIPYLE